ncbi:MAG: serine protease [Hyphomonas sp.]
MQRAIVVAAETLEASGFQPGWLLHLHGLSLVEGGALMPALGLAVLGRQTATEEMDAAIENECLYLEGRVWKQMFVAASSLRPQPAWNLRESYLLKAARAYGLAYRRSSDTRAAAYPAGNLLALSVMAQRSQVHLVLPRPAVEIANDIISDIDEWIARPEDRKDLKYWDYASAAECHAFLGQWDKAIEKINLFLEALKQDAASEGLEQISGFAVNATLRQFTEIWGADPKDPEQAELLNLLRLALITAEGGNVDLNAGQADHVMAVASAPAHGQGQLESLRGHYEKVFGTEGPMGVKRLTEIIDHSRLVCRLMIDNESGRKTQGTGFLVLGERIHTDYNGDVFIITNAHVASSDPADEAPCAPGETYARFDRGGFSVDIVLKDLVWSSHPTEHDASIFRVDRSLGIHSKLRDLASILKIGAELPPLKIPTSSGKSRASRVYVIGHPKGEELSISMFDNELLDYDSIYVDDKPDDTVRTAAFADLPGPRPRRVHYLAPTLGGNSGSPVFDSSSLNLIALHHAGKNMKRLNNKPGTYNANEGLWIRPMLNAFLLAQKKGQWNPKLGKPS